MPRTIWFVGNDGAGKSTFLDQYAREADILGKSVFRKHYYENIGRCIIRCVIGCLIDIHKQKKSGKNSRIMKVFAKREKTQEAETYHMRKRRKILIIPLWVYQIILIIESWLRELLCDKAIILMDRSFIDDMVSILETFNMETPVALLRWSSRMFPVRRVIYLFADRKIEYSRIVSLDLTEEFHRRKGTRYAEVINILNSTGMPIERIRTDTNHFNEQLAEPIRRLLVE